jgi:hypothetical protein
MAWTETFHCDVCGTGKSEQSTDWWLAWTEPLSPAEGEPEQPAMKLTPWNGFLAHSAEMRHLCGARCMHTLLDRWMQKRE